MAFEVAAVAWLGGGFIEKYYTYSLGKIPKRSVNTFVK